MSIRQILAARGLKVRDVGLRQSRAVRRLKARAQAEFDGRLDREDRAYALKHGDPVPGAEKGAEKAAPKRAAKRARVVEGPAEWEALARLAATVPKRKKVAPALRQQSGAGGPQAALAHGDIMGGETKDLK